MALVPRQLSTSPLLSAVPVASSAADVALLCLSRRGVIVAAHPAASAAAAAPNAAVARNAADAQADADWAEIITALDQHVAHVAKQAYKRGPAHGDDENDDDDDNNDYDDDDNDDNDDHATAVKQSNDTLAAHSPTTTTAVAVAANINASAAYDALAATERRGWRRPKKHGRLTRLSDQLKEDPQKALYRALRESFIALFFAVNVAVAAAIVTIILGTTPLAMFVITTGGVLLAADSVCRVVYRAPR
jgi:hypothetical protein